jgi:phosphopantetheinyl transferase
MDINRMTLYSESTQTPITVYYASAPLARDRSNVKNILARELLRDAAPNPATSNNPPRIRNDQYGCPKMMSGYPWPMAISFSYFKQEVWAAIAQTNSIGMDVENSINFCFPYPFNRVFSPDEFHSIDDFCNNKEDAAALLWSCKEAVVKNLGTGFHFIDPRNVRVHSCLQEKPFAYKVLVTIGRNNFPVLVKREKHLWLAISASG